MSVALEAILLALIVTQEKPVQQENPPSAVTPIQKQPEKELEQPVKKQDSPIKTPPVIETKKPQTQLVPFTRLKEKITPVRKVPSVEEKVMMHLQQIAGERAGNYRYNPLLSNAGKGTFIFNRLLHGVSIYGSEFVLQMDRNGDWISNQMEAEKSMMMNQNTRHPSESISTTRQSESLLIIYK